MVVEYNGGYEERLDVTVSNHMNSNNFSNLPRFAGGKYKANRGQ